MHMKKKKRNRLTPFGYKEDPLNSSYLLPISEDLETLKDVEESVVAGFINSREGSEWLHYKTGKSISERGLRKNIAKKYGRPESEERLGHKSRILSARRGR